MATPSAARLPARESDGSASQESPFVRCSVFRADLLHSGLSHRNTAEDESVEQPWAADEPIPVSEFCVKSDQWEYEREVRVVRCLSECKKVGQDKRGFPVYVQRIPAACIKSIILGERTPVAEQREIYARVIDTEIGLLLAAVDHAGYTFRHERIKFNVPYSKMGPMMSPRTAHIFGELQSARGEFARWMINHHPSSKIVNKPV